MNMRIGQGIDFHQFAIGRRLVLGGVKIPHDKGLLGHSDADALIHAIVDAILGALGEGDIGCLFPDTDPQWKGMDSMHFLNAAVKLAGERGFTIGNVDCTLMCEQPKMKPHVPDMKARLAPALGITPDRIGVKATTTEKMGFLGRGEGIGAMAVVLLVDRDER